MKLLNDREYNELLKKINEQDNKLAALNTELDAKKKVEIDGKNIVVTPGASSSKDVPQALDFLNKSLNVVTPDFDLDCIDTIRKLCKVNANFSQVINDLVRLANTGHKIRFDPSVGEAQVEKMRNFITDSSKHWHVGAAGVNSVVNKMFRQLFQAGAISNEWIPNANLDDLEELRFINPESIRFVVEKNTKGYQPYQKIRYKRLDQTFVKDLRKLNTKQFKYFAINGDTDLPYGCPLFIAAIPATATHKYIMDNLNHIVDQIGAFGFMEIKIAKPPMNPSETEPQYKIRLSNMLKEVKERGKATMRDGFTVGFLEDHEFEFHSTTSDSSGVETVMNLVEGQMASGLQTDPVFMGKTGGSETLVTVMFSKMIAQLKNTQDVVKENLEYGYRLLLTLGGFAFKSLSVEFNPSTITDDLKFQQAQEIKIRNLVVQYHYGIISLDQFADALGLIKPDEKEPRIDINNSDPMTGEVKKQKREDDKNKSARKSTDKKNPRGTVRKQSKTKNGSKSKSSLIERNVIHIDN